jgi:hypothetical protein
MIFRSFFVIIIASTVFLACNDSTSKEKKRHADSLFLGISLGMGYKEFYDHCWQLNKQKIVTHGPTNENVEYRLKNVLRDTVTMRFYPTFYEKKIFEMPVTFTYDKWAPWNKSFWSDSLLSEMIVVFKDWYGPEGWQEVDHPLQGKVYAKMDGSTRINLFVKDEQFVQAVFTDMKVENALKKANLEKEKPAENEE